VSPRTALVTALVLIGAGWPGPGRAQAAGPGDPPLRPEEPAMATPSPRASPEKVEDARNTAKAAELTPIVPSPRNPLHPAFQLYSEVDLPILGIGLVFASARLVRSQPAYCAPRCDPGTLNALDRKTAGYWNTRWQDASNYALVLAGVGAATLLFVDEGLLPGLNDAAVVAESALGGIALASMMTLAAGRPRPFLYGEKAPLSARNGADAGLSFLSSHAIAGFAIASSSFMIMRRLHPGSKVAWVVLGVGGGLAAFIAGARVAGGMHFLTDALGGAVVGTSLGVLIPSLHGSPVSIVPVAGEKQQGLAVRLQF
jgi:membrane-associated phospholipid phosphatase